MTRGVIMEEHSRGQRSERTPWKLKGQLGYTNTALFNPSSQHRQTTQQEGALVTSETSHCPSTWTHRPILKHGGGAIMSWDRWNYIQGQGEAELQRSGLMCWPSQSPDLNPADALHPVWMHFYVAVCRRAKLETHPNRLHLQWKCWVWTQTHF